MLDHVSLGVSNLERSRTFYDSALHPLGICRTVDFQGHGSDYGTLPAGTNGKFLKGPDYWKPEPKIRALLA